MYFDFEDNRPGYAAIPRPMSPREVVLITVNLHLLSGRDPARSEDPVRSEDHRSAAGRAGAAAAAGARAPTATAGSAAVRVHAAAARAPTPPPASELRISIAARARSSAHRTHGILAVFARATPLSESIRRRRPTVRRLRLAIRAAVAARSAPAMPLPNRRTATSDRRNRSRSSATDHRWFSPTRSGTSRNTRRTKASLNLQGQSQEFGPAISFDSKAWSSVRGSRGSSRRCAGTGSSRWPR